MTKPDISEDRFWAIIDEARKGSSASADPEALAAVLRGLPDREVSAFGYMFYEKLCELNFWRLWAAGEIIMPYMSDDSFHYFRSWIIGKGKQVFDIAIKDPDELGPFIDIRDVDNELLEYVAVNIMEKRTGEDPRELSDCDPDAAPRGEPFEMETVRRLCPRLASLFQ